MLAAGRYERTALWTPNKDQTMPKKPLAPLIPLADLKQIVTGIAALPPERVAQIKAIKPKVKPKATKPT